MKGCVGVCPRASKKIDANKLNTFSTELQPNKILFGALF